MLSNYSPFTIRPKYHYFFSSPLTALIHPLHTALLRLREPPRLLTPSSSSWEDDGEKKLNKETIRVVCISDTHSLEYPDIPDGDLLIHAGDLTNDGSVDDIQKAVDWLNGLPHAEKVIICGNHDRFFDPNSRLDEDRNRASDGGSLIDWGSSMHYLQHRSVTLTFPSRSITVYGAPDVPAIVPFGPEHAFTYAPDRDVWTGTASSPHRNTSMDINTKIDILVTHTPPQGHLDLSPVYSTGCPYLLAESYRVRPLLHVFGHIHAAYGSEPVFWDEAQRAWERLCASRRGRPSGSFLLGFVKDLVDFSGWLDAAKVIVYGVSGAFARPAGSCSWMVNAALMYRDSGQLRNKPQVFDI